MKSSNKKVSLLACVVFIAFAASVGRSAADTIAYTTSGTETDLGDYGMSGFEFTPSENISVTALGFTALSLGGDTPHVSLWNATLGLSSLSLIYDTGNIIGSVTSTGANTGTGEPSFVSVGAPIELTAGQTYLVTAPAYWTSTFTAGGITTASGVFSSTQFLTDNTGFFANGGWANAGYNFSSLTAAPSGNVATTPNVEFTIDPAPEPSTYAMLGAGLLVLLVMLRRKAAKIAVG